MTVTVRTRPLLINFLLWLLGPIVWVYNPLFSMEVFLHESGHAILAMLTGSKIVEFDLSPPDPHVTIEYHSLVARYIALCGGFLFTFFPYLFAFLYFVQKRKKLANFMIWPLVATFPSSWEDFRDLGLLIPHELIDLIYCLGTLSLFFLLNRIILKDFIKKGRKLLAKLLSK